MNKTCARCNDKFNPTIKKSGKINRSVYCSKSCARPILKKIILTCAHCGKKFQKFPSQVKSNKNTVFCGKQCVIDYRKIHWKGKVRRICIECGVNFKIYQSELKKCASAGKYCSNICAANNRTTILKCPTCKKIFNEYLSNTIRRQHRFCSKECYLSKTNPIEYFYKNISNEDHPKNCWIWIGKKDKDGYGIMYAKKAIRSHRYSYQIYKGEIPKDLLICHKCDIPSCVNPNHLYAGTFKDNGLDRTDKTRHVI